MNKKNRVLDIFSGIGGFSRAFVNEGFEIVAAIDRDSKACSIYKQNFPDVDVMCSDILCLDMDKLPDFDVLSGCICSKSIDSVKEVIARKRPRVFVLESGIRNREIIRKEMTAYLEMGYDTRYFVANSEKITGKPLVENKLYFIGTSVETKFGDILINESWKKIPFSEIMQNEESEYKRYRAKDLPNQARVIDPHTDRVTCNYINIPYVEISDGFRRITIREYARLKGFPEDYIFEENNIWQLYKMILCSTNIGVAGIMAKSIKEWLGEEIAEEKQNSTIKKNLTNSQIDRQNILNNALALREIEKTANIKGIIFENKAFFTKNMIASFFEVDIRTVERYVASNEEELKKNGYELLKGRRLKEFKECLKRSDISSADIGTISSKVTQLSIFDFKSFLNIAMLLVESENAKLLRQTMLSIVIDFINKKTGGATTYVNQRDRAFLTSYLQEEDYRKEFTDALKNYVDMDKFKYALFTDKIYKSIFKENAKEYREILRLKKKDRTRETFYSEILDLVAAYECGLAEEIKNESTKKGRKLSNWETQKIFNEFENLPHWKPLITSARTKMASRDLALRDAFHQQLQMYMKPLEKDEYDRFLGSEADQIAKLMDENKDVLKRLKERG